MKKIQGLIKKSIRENREIISYLFWGGCTTLINIACYGFLYDYLSVSNVMSNIVAWVAAVVFAFYVNKIFVFRSRGMKMSQQLKEATAFFGCRILTLVLDVAIMAIAVDFMEWNAMLWKILSNVIVIILNYMASKFWIFKKKGK